MRGMRGIRRNRRRRTSYMSGSNSVEGYLYSYAKRRIKAFIFTIIFVVVFFTIIMPIMISVLSSHAADADGSPAGNESAYVADSQTGSKSAYAADNKAGNTSAHSAGSTAGRSSANSAGNSNDKKNIGDEIGTIIANRRWQKFEVYTDGEYSNDHRFKIKVPDTGYLAIYVSPYSDSEPGNYVKFSAPGFRMFENLKPEMHRTYIGVSKGSYDLDGHCYGSGYDMKIRFVKVRESKYGKTSGSAPVLKKGRTCKGVITTDKQQTHWYKIKHTSNRPIRVKARTLSSSGGMGGIEVAVYQGGRCVSYSRSIKADEVMKLTAEEYKGSKRLEKGICYIKVSSGLGGNGYYSLKWK